MSTFSELNGFHKTIGKLTLFLLKPLVFEVLAVKFIVEKEQLQFMPEHFHPK